MVWSSYLVVAIFITVSYYVLRWVQRRSQYINLPKLGPGQWDPLVANYSWTVDTKFKEDFNKLREDPSATGTALAQALMKRAMHDVSQMMEMHEQKSTLQALVKSGSIGEEVWNRFLGAEESLNQECKSVVEHAELLKPGWGDQILPQASKMLAIEKQRQAELERMRIEEDRKAQQEWSQQRSDLDMKDQEETARKIADELIRQEELEKQQRKSSGSAPSSSSSAKKKK